MHLVFS